LVSFSLARSLPLAASIPERCPMQLSDIKDKMPLNFELAGNPVNWVIVFLMIAIAGLALSLIFHPAETGD
jgi:hypothetical protein